MLADRILTHVRKLPSKKAQRINLHVLGIDGQQGEDLGDWIVADYEGELAKDLGLELWQAGQFDADERGGSRKYVVIGTDRDGSEVYKWNMRFVAESKDETAPTLDLDEPSQQGLLAQVMRHQERQFTACMGSQERIIRSLHEQLELRDRRIVQLEKRELEVAEMARALHLHSADDVSGERNADRIDKAIGLFTEKFLPAAGVQLGLLPEGFTTDGEVEGLKQTKIETSQDTTVEPPAQTNASQPG